MTPRIRDRRNFASAVLFVGFAALLGGNALTLRIGTAEAMGPGYFPLALALILGILGLLIGIGSLRVDGPPIGAIGWRGLVFVTLAIVAFGATIQRLGFVPAVVASLVLAVLASPRFGWRAGVLVTLVLLAGCWLVFVRGLGLPVRLFG
jgi:putative tricarboxylic transport membrane protein